MNSFRWPVLIYVLYLPFIYGQGTLYKLNPELANEFVMPVLLAAQPVLLPIAGVSGAAYAFTRKQWLRRAFLGALWTIAIEFLFSLRLEPLAAVAKVDH